MSIVYCIAPYIAIDIIWSNALNLTYYRIDHVLEKTLGTH